MNDILTVRDLSVHFRQGKRLVQLVDRVSFSVARGECLGILGESGSGKSMTCKALLGLLDDAELDNFIREYTKNHNIDLPEDYGTYNYEDFLGLSYKIITTSDLYAYDEDLGFWRSHADAGSPWSCKIPCPASIPCTASGSRWPRPCRSTPP